MLHFQVEIGSIWDSKYNALNNVSRVSSGDPYSTWKWSYVIFIMNS